MNVLGQSETVASTLTPSYFLRFYFFDLTQRLSALCFCQVSPSCFFSELPFLTQIQLSGPLHITNLDLSYIHREVCISDG
jgi:hypothetical protein